MISAINGTVAKKNQKKTHTHTKHPTQTNKKTPDSGVLHRFGFVWGFLVCFVMGYWVREKEMWF